MIIYDSHIHMGVLTDGVIIHPNEIKMFISRYGVKGGLIMPTAHVGGDDNLALHEMLYCEAINCGFQIALYLNLDVLESLKRNNCDVKYPFSAFKIHPEAVNFSEKDLDSVCSVIGRANKPLLIHTGGIECAQASRFERIISKYKQQIFVLCHGRPLEEAFSLLNKYDNVWIDTSFLPMHKAQSYFTEDNVGRILFGSDYPINRWFSELPDEDSWYQKQIANVSNNYTTCVSEMVLRENYIKLFGNSKDYGIN